MNDIIHVPQQVYKSNVQLDKLNEVLYSTMPSSSWDISSKINNPDIITFGKGIANGYPLAGVATTTQIMEKMSQGILGGTYGGNALVCAVGYKTLEILSNSDLQINTKSLMLRNILEAINGVKEVRSYGLMIAIELEDPILTKQLVTRLFNNDVLVLTAKHDSSIIRLLPSLNISYDEIEKFLEIFSNVFTYNQ